MELRENTMMHQCAEALQKTRQGVAQAGFPNNVFLGEWSAYLFFDSDWVFDPTFVEQVKRLLSLEGSTCACLVALDNPRDDENHLYVLSSTEASEYRLRLLGDGPDNGWVYDFGRYACSSELSNWFIYCERSAEIAVIALKKDIPVDRAQDTLSAIGAVSIEEAIAGPLSFGFSPEGLSDDWRARLIREYGQSQG